MTKAPERIWAQHDTAAHMDTLREMAVKPVDEVAQAFTPYLRADLAKAAEAAAYERAAKVSEDRYSQCEGANIGQCRLRGCAIGNVLRHLIDHEAASALDAARAEVRRECVASVRAIQETEIAEIIWSAFGGNDVARSSQAAKRVVEAIAAAIMEDKDDE